LAKNGLNAYYYAPKEDPLHRFQWRDTYPVEWLQDFSRFCTTANQLGIDVVAGVAPGLDFDFKDLPAGDDYRLLLNKCGALLKAGARFVSLLLDDIDENFNQRAGSFHSEGDAHASLANTLGHDLDENLWVTPRVYANELAISDPSYLPDFLRQLSPDHSVLYCGSDVVARIADTRSIDECAPNSDHTIVLWDNLYANDYCPRRLYIGPWVGRETATNIVLNPTGMIETDCLLLDLMSKSLRANKTDANGRLVWETTLRAHGVPDAFFELTDYFYHPVFNDGVSMQRTTPDSTTYDAIEQCLWEWKTPLSREWYSYIFGLKHDLQAANGLLPVDRIHKTQSQPLANVLLNVTKT